MQLTTLVRDSAATLVVESMEHDSSSQDGTEPVTSIAQEESPATTEQSGAGDEPLEISTAKTSDGSGAEVEGTAVKKVSPEKPKIGTKLKDALKLPSHPGPPPTYAPKTIIWWLEKTDNEERPYRAWPGVVMDHKQPPISLYEDSADMKERESMILILTDGRVQKARKTNIYDFCRYFASCYPLMRPSESDPIDERELRQDEAVKLAVKLAALRLNMLNDNGCTDTNWRTWAMGKLPAIEELPVTDIFYEKICGVQVKLNYEKRGIKMKPEKATKSKPAAAPVGTSPKPTSSTPSRARNKDVSEDDLRVPLDLGWRREISVRKPPSKKFGDVYYYPPKIGGKKYPKLRSMNEVAKFLATHSGTAECEGLELEKNFSFRDQVIIEHENHTLHGAADHGVAPGQKAMMMQQKTK